jgi:hypothetical protein
MTETITKISDVSIEQLWESAPVSERIFNPDSLTHSVAAGLVFR